jgi:hypothetical protein
MLRMHAMEDRTKARLVWKEASLKEKELDDAVAAALGHDLEWAATWFEVVDTSRKPKLPQIVCLEDIARTVRMLSQLLTKNDLATRRLERFYPYPEQPNGPPSLSEIERGLTALEVAAKEALEERKKVNPTPSPLGIIKLATVYEEYAHRRPGVATNNGKKEGPFVRFVQETACQYEFHPPAGSTIATALRKIRAADKRVI